MLLPTCAPIKPCDKFSGFSWEPCVTYDDDSSDERGRCDIADDNDARQSSIGEEEQQHHMLIFGDVSSQLTMGPYALSIAGCHLRLQEQWN
ncbi:hypothetical protein OESDEN_00741 [Oesophagostomum dentatum]|uniref:Uncharacterized protein n=1 Tax=Oesophagostomum dentatum TaxID=61180 RepID=A0A0B1TTW5_OESDE|nr:hypothetical protein OESDEN_00741 [Oesophagostomum dentatum]